MKEQELSEISKSIKSEIETKKEYKRFNKILIYKRTEPHEFKFKNIPLYLITLLLPKTAKMEFLNKGIFSKLKIGQTGTVLTNVRYNNGKGNSAIVSFKKVYPYFSSNIGLIIGHATYKIEGNYTSISEINIFGETDNNRNFHVTSSNSAKMTIEG